MTNASVSSKSVKTLAALRKEAADKAHMARSAAFHMARKQMICFASVAGDECQKKN